MKFRPFQIAFNALAWIGIGSLAGCGMLDKNLRSLSSERCARPVGVSGSPQSIEAAVDLINALPAPVSVSCLIESLDRPLKLLATDSQQSAQPAGGTRSPRIFIFSGPLVLAVVPDGFKRDSIEMSVLHADGTSLKGALDFPILQRLPRSAPYDRIRIGTSMSTTCGSCHFGERGASGITFTQAFDSRAIAPSAASEVDLGFLQKESAACNSAKEPERCRMLNALFGGGPVAPQKFPAGI